MSRLLFMLSQQRGKATLTQRGIPSSYHGVGPFMVETGKVDPALKDQPERTTMTRAFSKALLALADKDPAITAVTAAMSSGTGLKPFREKYPRPLF